MSFLKGLGKFFALIISILISIITLILIIYLGLNKFMQPSNLKQLLSTKNILHIELEESSIKDNIVEIFEEFEISTKDAEDIVESKAFQEFLDDYINKVVDYYLKNESFPEFDENKLQNILELTMSKNNTLTEEQKNMVKDSLIKEKNEIEETLPTREQILGDNFIKETVELFSNTSVLYFIGAILILMFLIFILTYSLYKPFKYVGISLVVSSIITIIGYLFKNNINIDKSIIFIINNLFNQILISSLTILIVGVLFIIIYIVINKVKTKEVK